MRKPSSWALAFNNADSVEDVLRLKGLHERHLQFKEIDRAYTAEIEALIAGGLPRETPAGSAKQEIAAAMARHDRLAMGQPDLPFLPHEVARQREDALIAALEKRLPMVFIEATGATLPIRAALSDPETAVLVLDQLDARRRVAYGELSESNWLYCTAAEAARRLEKKAA